MDFIKCVMSLLFLGILMSFSSKQVNAAPISNETEDIEYLKGNVTDILKMIQEIDARLDRLENANSRHCKENASEEMVAYEIMGVKISEGDDDDDNDEDDDEEEEEKNKEPHTKNIMERLLDEIKAQNQREEKGDRAPGRSSCPYVRRQDYEDYTTHEHKTKPENVSASCTMRPNKALPPEQRLEVHGKILLEQKDSETLVITAKISGMNSPNKPNGVAHNITTKHGFHVHQHGNLSNGCESAGPHFNPFNKTHGGPATFYRHLGDFGNLESDLHGNIDSRQEFKLERALTGPHSIIGKTLVIHAVEDDLGVYPNDNASMTTGNSGARLACCIIKKLPV